MKQNLLFNRASAFGMRFIMVLTMLLVVGIGQAWGAEGDTHNFSQSLSQLLNNNATVASIEIAEQSYAIKTVKVTSDYNKSAGGVTMEVLVAGTSWGKETHNSDETKTFTFSGTSTKGKVTIKFTNNCGSGTGKGTFKVTNVQLVEGAASKPYTVTFHTTATKEEEIEETSAGSGVTPPTMEEECGDWKFQGWSESFSVSETSTTKLDLVTLDEGIYYPAADVDLYPVYTKSDGEGGTVTWDKITTAPTDWSGEYLIVNSNYAMTSDFYSGTSGEFKGASVTISNNQVTSSPTDKMIWIVEKNGSNAQYAFKNKSTGTYAKITGTSSTNAALSSSVIWFTISSSSTSGVWKINSVDYSARCFSYYSSNKTFRTYANSSNTTGSLYKKNGSSSTTYYYSYPQCITETTVSLIPKITIF